MSHQDKEQGQRETKRLYFEDAYQKEFEATVVDKFRFDGKPAVVLDQTCFYPESGGQPSDRGFLGEAAVVQVLEDGERIVHLLEKDIDADKVRGSIDWPRRFDHMQQHSGQHILSQSFFELLRGETLSFHLGEAISTLEIGIRAISDSDVSRVEERANEVVFEDREIKTYFIPEEKVSSIPLRRPPKKEGLIRVVEVSGFDYSACGGTHCRRTGEIGLTKVIKWEKIRGNLRFEFLCGRRAIEDYAWKNRALVEMAARFSANEKNIPAAMEKTVSELKQARKKMRQLQEKLAGYEAEEIIKKSKERIITAAWTDKTPEEGKLLALNIIKAGEFAVLYGIEGEERNHLVFASSETLPLDMRELLPLVFSHVQGKGGGSSSLVEIVIDKDKDLKELLKLAFESINQKLKY
ncbi:MAG: alanine--tRNA ligase-related protein [Clostridiales bacterium]|nr:alanine--tRNA ligase-related protein [Clostridiales bacterium]